MDYQPNDMSRTAIAAALNHISEVITEALARIEAIEKRTPAPKPLAKTETGSAEQ